jgi:peroxiredoxin
MRNLLWKTTIPVLVLIFIVFSSLWFIKRNLPGNTRSLSNIQVGTALPDFVLERSDAGTTQLSKIQAKIILINFWATWCDSCMVEIPSIVKLRSDYHARGFEVIAINVDENPIAVLPKTIQRFKIDFPLYVDTNGVLSDLFNVNAIPLTVILDKNREILFIESGERDWNGKEIRSKLEQWL